MAGEIVDNKNRPIFPVRVNVQPVVENDDGGNIDPVVDGGGVRVGEIPVGGGENIVPQPGMLRVHGANDQSIFDANTRVYNDCVSMPTLLRAMGQGGQLDGTIDMLCGEFTKLTGLPVSDDVKAQIKANPELLGEKLAVTPQQMADALAALAQAHNAELLPANEGEKHDLPNNFDLAKIAEADVPLPKFELKKLATGIYQGDKPGDLSPEQMKRNIVLSKVFNQLSLNAKLDEGEKPFKVKFGKSAPTRVSSLLNEMKEAGYNVEVTFEHRVANFANLKTKRDDQPDSAAKHVPFALMVKDEVDGQEVVLPSVHAEMVVKISGSPEGMPNMDGSIKFYQGVSDTGWFPCDLSETHPWLGMAITPIAGQEKLSGDLAWKLVEIAGLDTDLINQVAKDLNLPADGYGNLGVCLNSVQRMILVANMLTKVAPDLAEMDIGKMMKQLRGMLDRGELKETLDDSMIYYPLLGSADPIAKEITERLGDNNHRDDPEYRLLKGAVTSVHRDAGAAAEDGAKTRYRRMLYSLPWAKGLDAFHSTAKVRQILEQALGIAG